MDVALVIVRSAYPLKTFATLDEAEKYAAKISKGAGRHADSELEIHYNSKVRPETPMGTGKKMMVKIPDKDEEEPVAKPWAVMVLNEGVPPGAKPCAECESPFFGDDYLCPECRDAG